MSTETQHQLSRRERQIMDILYEHPQISAQEVRQLLPNPPSYSAVRAMLAKLLDKGIVKYREEGARYIYSPTVEPEDARASALKKMVKTFFAGSSIQAVNALLGMQRDELSEQELSELENAIKEARKQ